MNDMILSIQQIVKRYPGVTALDNVSIDFMRGEIHGLVGENGAGKSTLIKIIAGAEAPDSGKFVMEGWEFTQITPKHAMECGIQVIYQEFNLVPSLSVAENIFLGEFPGNKITVSFQEMIRRSRRLFAEMEVDIDPEETVEHLSVAKMQLVEIAKSLSRDVRLLIMDEPTAPLTTHETASLFRLIEKLRQRGVTIIYISHRMNELYRLTDRMTVLRDGKTIETRVTAQLERQELIRLMVGRDLKETFPERSTEIGEPVLEVKHLSGNGFRDISFQLCKGEVLGFAGLVGSGRTELVRAIFGADPLTGGEIILEGRHVKISSPRRAVDLQIGLLPEDRKRQSVITGLSVKFNITLAILRRISTGGVIRLAEEKQILEQQKKNLTIRTPSFDQKVGNLSGGNQQKVALSKWLAGSSRILIFDEPTRGIDVGAKQEIYRLINELTQQGISIIMVSSELEEVLGVSDRIIVLHEGRKTGEVTDDAQFTQEHVMNLAAGG